MAKSIHFVPNDPRAAAFKAARKQAPRKDRPAGRATFDTGTMPAAKEYPAGSDGALAWQSREAALAAVEMFEGLHGPVTKWARSSRTRTLNLGRDEGVDLNAYYDGESVMFFHHPVGARTFFSGASTDVVSHEVGHALLDTIRPALWDSNYSEVAAFHEAFGDCIAMLTALADDEIRWRMVKRVGQRNFVETWGEDLAWAVRKVLGKKHNASKPRQARNTFQWALPATLPDDGPGGALINEPHCFGQVFTGCFYDVIAALYAKGPKNEAALWNAAGVAAKALFAAAKAAAITPRFYQAVGRAMALHDTSDAGVLRGAVHDAFDNHGIALGSAATAVPRAMVAGRRLRSAAVASPALMPATSADLRLRLGAARGAPLHVRAVALGGERFVEASHQRRVDLTGLAGYLRGVSALGSEPVLVAPVRGAMAIMSSVPEATATSDEVQSFVRGLVARDEIAHGAARTAASGRGVPGRRAGVEAAAPGGAVTHKVVRDQSGGLLRRVRFACGCGRTHFRLPID